MSASEIQELLRGQLVLLEKRALAALDQVSSLEELLAWKRVYIEGKSPAPEGALFSTFITNEEILRWEPAGDLPMIAELADEAYCRWQDEDREQAERYSGVWDGHVQAAPGGYHVWIEAETQLAPCTACGTIPTARGSPAAEPQSQSHRENGPAH